MSQQQTSAPLGKLISYFAVYDSVAHFTPIRALANRGIAHQKMDHYREALADFDRVIELEGKNDWIWYCRAQIYFSRGELDAFERDIQTAIALAQAEWERKPDDYRGGFDLALYRLLSGKKENLKEQYEQLASLCPSAGWLQDAITDLTEVLALRADDAIAHEIHNQLQKRLIELQAAER